ncbi:hypothetical protein SAMN02910406_01204 [Ruminococcus albus]|uniref:Uncharacterized protein n=1 Tax=Ruminococcus albus TaxID=1264 RepID=A0A1I1GKV5_RUMAL|nr:hypothetical protein SAMN02910406_01204 [Ruminococcus albus]
MTETNDPGSDEAAKFVLFADESLLDQVDTDIIIEHGHDVYIIGSDDSLNYNVPSYIDVDEIRNIIAEKSLDSLKYDYFFVGHSRNIEYVAVRKKNSDIRVGTFPQASIPKVMTDYGLETEEVDFSKIEDYTLEELFEIAKETITEELTSLPR